jgi:DNA-directed RNA polymerase specialized sigma24 family protein
MARARQLPGGSAGDDARHGHVSTRCDEEKRAAGAHSSCLPLLRRRDVAEEVAIVAGAQRSLLLRVHRHRLRREDLEDCYSQACLELVAHARRGGAFADRGHIANAIQLRFLSRVRDRHRAINGRRSLLCALEQAVPLGNTGDEEQGVEVTDARASVEAVVLARDELRALWRAAQRLTADQRRVLASQLAEERLSYGAGEHPDPRGALEEDCSSTINYVLYRSGVRPIAEILAVNPLAQDYVHWGLPGPGRWVTIYSTTSPTDHTFMTIAGLRLDTSHNGTDVGPNASEDGPRWRILDHIPTWAHWSVRHPPGL